VRNSWRTLFIWRQRAGTRRATCKRQLWTILTSGRVLSEIRAHGYVEATGGTLRDVTIQALALRGRERTRVELVDQLFWVEIDYLHGATSS